MNNKKPTRLLSSRAYLKASSLAKELLKSPERVTSLIAKAQEKLTNNKSTRLAVFWDSILASCRLVKSYVAGDYRDISFESLALIVASIAYFVMPFDVVPDFIVALGLSDDALLIGWTLRSVKDDLAQFLAWEKASGIDETDVLTENDNNATPQD